MAVAASKVWTVEELDRLPEDGNIYEVIDGELLVTPAPTQGHEQIVARLTRLLDRFVEQHGLGIVFSGHAALRVAGTSVEPDLMVRALVDDPNMPWEQAPLPILVVEVHSAATRHRDQLHKRDFYMSRGIPEYWMVDPDARTITQVRPGQQDAVAHDTLAWSPAGAREGLTFDVRVLFSGN